jgi:ubiquinol oxidase
VVNKILKPDPEALAGEAVAEPVIHHQPKGFSDRFALGFTKLLRLAADTFRQALWPPGHRP